MTMPVKIIDNEIEYVKLRAKTLEEERLFAWLYKYKTSPSCEDLAYYCRLKMNFILETGCCLYIQVTANGNEALLKLFKYISPDNKQKIKDLTVDLSTGYSINRLVRLFRDKSDL